MDQLKVAWVYRFWIVVGVVLLLPIIGYFVSTRSLAESAKQRASQLEGTKNSLESAAKATTYNQESIQGVTELKEALAKQVHGAWEELYERQSRITDWPKSVEQAYLAAGEKGDVHVDIRLQYQRDYPAQLTELVRRVQPVGVPGSKELVQMAPELIMKYQPAWVGQAYPPSVHEARLAQEDIWILRALLDVIVQANKDATKLEESPVKRILDLQLGGAAADETLMGKTPKEQLSAPDDPSAAAATGAAAKTSTAKLRYIKGTLFDQIPVYLHLHIDQRKLLDVLAAFSGSDIPMEIKQVEFEEVWPKERAPIPGAVSTRAAGDSGAAPAKEDTYFHMTDLKVWARAYMYREPPSLKAKREQAKAN